MPVLVENPKHKTTYVTIPRNEYGPMKSTIEVLEDDDLIEQIKDSSAAIKEGKVSKWNDVLKERGLI